MPSKNFRFIAPGLSVYSPAQNGVKIEAIIKPDVDYPTKTPNFELIRAIGNIAIFRKDHLISNQLGKTVTQFNPMIELRVHFGQEDLKEAGNDLSQLKLAYWDLTQWVIISDSAHGYRKIDPQTVAVKIDKWTDDPTIGWGR